MQKAIASSSVLHEHVAAAADGAVHLGAAHLLERHLLADDHLGHARAAQVHAGVALDHHDHVAEGRDVRAAGRARAEEQAHLRHLPAHLHLVVEDAPRAAPAREHLDLVGDARARAVDQVEHRHARRSRRLLDAQDLLDRAPAPRAGLHRRVVGHDRPRGGRRCSAVPGDDAVGRQLGIEVVGEGGVLRRSSPASTQAGDALAGEELALLGVLLVVLGRAPLLDAGEGLLQLLLGRHGRGIDTPLQGRKTSGAETVAIPPGLGNFTPALMTPSMHCTSTGSYAWPPGSASAREDPRQPH